MTASPALENLLAEVEALCRILGKSKRTASVNRTAFPDGIAEPAR